MTGDELIAYGFKRIIEELQELRGAVDRNTALLAAVGKDTEKIVSASRRSAELCEKIEQSTNTTAGKVLRIASLVDNIVDNTLQTEVAAFEIKQALERGRSDDGMGT